MQIVTKRLLELGMDENRVINESQLVLLDLKDLKDWETSALDKEISDARAELFVLLRGIDKKEIREKIISSYKALQIFRKEDVVTPGDVTIYCDGGCTPNPGKAGSGVAVYRAGEVSELWYGLYEEMGTNNTAELGALYQSLLIAEKEAQKANKVEIKCDSMYAINCIKTWAVSWEKKGWTKKGGEIKNLEIIQRAYHLYNKIKKDVSLTHIKAHAGYEGNELADRMTMYAIQERSEAFVKYAKKIEVEVILNMREG